MRIVIFTESYEPIINGVSVFVGTLRDEMTRRGHEVFIFAPQFKGYKDNHDNVFRWPSRHTVLMPDYPFPLPWAPQLAKVFQSLNADIVHTQTPFILGITAARWARNLGIPLVSTNHTLYTEYAHYVPVRPMIITKLAIVQLMKWYYSKCDLIVAPSRTVEQILRSYGITRPIEVVKTGVVPAAEMPSGTREKVRSDLGIGPEDFVLLYVGRIAREKNLDMLLRAFAKLLSGYPRVKLLLVGGGPALRETRRLASRLGIEDSVRFVGALRRPDIDPIFVASDVFVFPSTTETQGIAICEAMSAGLPVVAVNAGGIPENISDGVDGILTPDDPDAFASAVERLMVDDEERRRMGMSAKQNASRFSVEAMGDRFEKIYSDVIKSRKCAVCCTP
ncbi:MAG: glycosyltransferase family 4 protein [Armatimonadota bacterium]|nr:glycosyltransferase family 4 protein [Armatimonadota bacterium]